ncbi:L-galactose dehydrogenase [Diplonema papillatum]|nr:L-galactose dehydrogenase [Diplonema papillatum]
MSDWVKPDTFVEGFHDLEQVKKMKYRHLENVGLVSIVAFGASGLGGMYTAGGSGIKAGAKKEEESVWWMEDPEEEKEVAKKVVHAYLKAGGNVIDAAHWYGQGKAERLLGHALKDVPRSAYYIFTKIARYDKDLLKMFDFSYDRTVQGVQDSLKRLQLKYVDGMQVHDPEFCPDIDIVVNETVRGLYKAKEDGLIRLVGMTGYPLKYQEEIMRKCKEAGRPIHTSLTYCRYTLADRELLSSSYWKTCKELKIGVINASPIGMGLLMNRSPPAWHPATPAAKEVCQKAISYCQSQNVDISKLAMHFVLRREEIATTLVSTTNIDRMHQNLACAYKPLTAEEDKVLDYIVKNIFEPAGNTNWEGVEVTEYWQQVGKKLALEKFYGRSV